MNKVSKMFSVYCSVSRCPGRVDGSGLPLQYALELMELVLCAVFFLHKYDRKCSTPELRDLFLYTLTASLHWSHDLYEDWPLTFLDEGLC